MAKKKKSSTKMTINWKKTLQKKWWIWLCSAIVLWILLSIPSYIDSRYMEGLQLQVPNTMFTASDWLTFYGTIISGLITLIALVVTIKFTSYHSSQEQKHQKAILLADYNKEKFLQDHEEFLQYAEKIKKLYLLEALNDSGELLAQFFKTNRVNIIIRNFSDLQYWLQKLNLSDNTIEREFQDFIENFSNNIICAGIDAQKELEIIDNYKKEYEEKKEQFDKEKRGFLQKNPDYKYKQFLANYSHQDLPNPPYGIFDMDEPPNEKEVMANLIHNLKSFRDEHKDSFLISYEAILSYKQEKLSEEIEKLYNFD